MAPLWQSVDYPRTLLVALTLLVGVTLLIGGLSSTTVFGAYNPAWDGVSELRTLADDEDAATVVAQETNQYGEVDGGPTLGVVLSPASNYSEEETARVERFVRGGGTLLVAEDVGTASNNLLERIGADARLDGAPIRDERFNDDSPELAVATNVTNHTYTAGVDRLTLNRGTEVEPNGADVLVNTSSFAYLDRNGNGELDDSESLRERPVVTVESVGDGSVVVVGDPSLFINVMLDRPDNRAFAANLISAHETVLFDVSHVAAVPPLVAGQLFLQRVPVAELGVGISLVLLISFWGWPAAIFERVRHRIGHTSPDGDRQDPLTDPESVERFVRTRHPEWDRERVRRVTEGIMGGQSKDGDND